MRTQSILGKISEGAHEASFGAAFLILRAVTGAMFLATGWAKITSDWSAASYLSSANGPFADWFHSLAGSGLIDSVNAWGLFLLGVAILLGLLIRPASILGAVLMVLYYLSDFSQNTANGLMNEHIILIAALALFAAGGAGHAFGVNAVVLGNLRKPNRLVKFLFG